MSKPPPSPRLQWAPLRVGNLPAVYPLTFYLRALLPELLGGRPLYESVALCDCYDPELVRAYLMVRASAARVRGDDRTASRMDELARKVQMRMAGGGAS